VFCRSRSPKSSASCRETCCSRCSSRRTSSALTRETRRWRTVRDLERLEEYLVYAYSDPDFFLGLQFKQAVGPKRWIYLHELLISTNAL